jgi:hypothetical protein
LPLIQLDEHQGMKFEELHERICDALRGNRVPVALEVLLPEGTHRIIRQRKSSGASGAASAEADPAQ